MNPRPFLLFLLLVTACFDKPPSGQVLARVNGLDVTRRDLLVELAPDGASSTQDDRDLRAELLEQVITRKLLVEEAKRQDVDKSPEYLGQMQRLREILLVTELRRRLAGRLPTPPQKDIARFIAAKGTLFDNRQVHRVDQIRIYGRPNIRAIAGISSITPMTQWLDNHKIPYERTEVIIDSLDPEGELLQSAGDKPVISKIGRELRVQQILATSVQPVSSAEREAVTKDKLIRQAESSAFDTLNDELRQRAKIEYQKGFSKTQ